MSYYTSEQLQKIKDAAFKVADAKSMFEDVANEMAAAGTWAGQADILRAASDIKELTENCGSLTWMIRTL